MIEINLLPEELRKKKSAGGASQAAGLELALYAVPVIIALLALIHVYLGILAAGKTMAVSAVERKWRALEPQKKQIELLKNAGLSEDVKALRDKIGRSMSVAEKFSRMNQLVPDGIWFNEAFLSAAQLEIKCSAVSAFSGDEMGLINDLMSALKKDPAFMKGVLFVDSGAASRRQAGSVEVVDFVLTVTFSADVLPE